MQCRDAWPSPLFILFLIYSSHQGYYKNSGIAAFVRGVFTLSRLSLCARQRQRTRRPRRPRRLRRFINNPVFIGIRSPCKNCVYCPDPTGGSTLDFVAWPRIVRVGGTTSFSSVRVPNIRFRALRISAFFFVPRFDPSQYVCSRSHSAAAIAAAIATAVIVSAIALGSKGSCGVSTLCERKM